MLRNPFTKETLLECQCIYKNALVPYEVYKRLRAYQEQVSYMAKILNLIDQCLKNSSPDCVEEIKFLELCLKRSKSLSKELAIEIKEEPINLGNLLEQIKLFFMDKTYKFNIMLKISCPANLFFHGDPFLTEFLLINLIGKSVYCAPKDSKIIVAVRKTTRIIEVKVQDNGFSLNKVRKELIKKSFEFYIEDNLFQQICQENGFIYEFSRPRQGSNITKIIIPNVSPEDQKSNVIQLFTLK